MMDRLKVIQTLMQQKGLRNYLEIGVFSGHILFRVKSTFKIAIDPDFRFDVLRKIGKTIINPFNLFNHYFKKTSDDFFEQDAAKVIGEKKIEIALIDGMHEYAYVQSDVENVIRYLDNEGVIVLHDCNPIKEESAVSFAEWQARGQKGVWNGDVWKTILNVRSLRPDLTAFVLDCDYGLGIIVKKPSATLPFSKEDIDRFNYNDFNANRKEWLNLQPADYLYEFFNLSR